MSQPYEALKDQFSAWYRHNLPRLFNYISYWAPDNATAEDLTASICEQALRGLPTFDPARGTLDGWIFGIARNALKMHYRARRRQPALISLDMLPEIRSSNGRLPEHLVEQAELFREVLRHLDLLREKEREAVALRYGAGYGNSEIADMMRITANEVGVLLYRAKERLREAMHELEE